MKKKQSWTTFNRSCIIWIGIIDKQYTVAYSEAMVTDKVLKLFIGLIFKIQSML